VLNVGVLRDLKEIERSQAELAAQTERLPVDA
jgi:hypothetical protein